MQVADQFQMIGISITEQGLIAPLEQMPGFPVAPIVILGMGELERLHRAPKRDLFGFNQQMDVIGHQDKRIAPETIPPPVPFQAGEIRLIVRLIMKERRAAIAAGNDVIEGAGEFHARFSSPRQNLQKTTYINSYSCLTPFFLILLVTLSPLSVVFFKPV